MKKISKMLSIALAGLFFAACNADIEDWKAQQVYEAEQAITIPGVNASALGAINLNEAEDYIQLVSVAQAALPEGYTIQHLRMAIEPTDGAEPILMESNDEGAFSAAELQQMIKDAYGLRPTNRTFNAHVYATAMRNGEGAYLDLGKIQLNLTPKAPKIGQNYYVIGGVAGWSAEGAYAQKFSHSAADVYDDPVFSIVIDAAAEGDTWFAIGDDEAIEAVADNDWSKLLGVVGGESTATEGKLDYRYNMGADNSFCVPAGAKKIKVVIDMMDGKFTVTPVSISDKYYLIGSPGEWNAESAFTMPFSHSDKDVFDDPVFTFTFAGTGSDMWFAFGDEEAINAVAEGTWNKLFGTTGASEDLTGSFDRRYNLDGDHSFHVDGTAKFYRFEVNMVTSEYSITTLDFQQYIYFIGATDGWANAEQKLESPDNNGIYTGFIYMADPNGWGNEFKFQKTPGDWGTEINSGHMTGGINGDLADGGGNFKATAGEGVYYVTLDLTTNTLSGVRIQNMNLVGDFNGWNAGDDAQQMTWNAQEYCYEITGAGVNANGWKFTTNNSWDINLGGDTLDNLVANGANITAVGTTIKLYPTRKTSDKIYCTVE